MKLQLQGPIRKTTVSLAGVFFLFIGASALPCALSAQSPTQPSQQANSPSAQTQTPSAAPAAGDNPFPGEAADVPIIPVDSGPPAARGSVPAQPTAEAESVSGSRPDPDGDPVRSPDVPGMVGDDGFSSSRVGLASAAAGPEVDSTPGKTGKVKTRDQVVKENEDVGEFYLERKNWKAALLRFQDAFTLDSESPDAVWGMAEAEHHLEILDKAREHYLLFLSYDSQGPHAKAARKALDQLEHEHPTPPSPSDSPLIPHK